MILSKQNLQTVNITRVDSAVPALDNVHIAEDGSTIGVGGKMTIAVAPVKEDVKHKIQNIITEAGAGGMTISADTVRHILKDMPADKQFGGLLEHCNIEKINDEECRITLTDGKRKRNIVGKIYRREYVPYRPLFKVAMEVCVNGTSRRIVLNLKRLLLLLQTIEKVAPDTSGDSPVWIEFTDSDYIIVRGINMITGQRAIGVMSSFTGTEGKWLEPDEWERSFVDAPRPVVKHKIKHKIK